MKLGDLVSLFVNLIPCMLVWVHTIINLNMTKGKQYLTIFKCYAKVKLVQNRF